MLRGLLVLGLAGALLVLLAGWLGRIDPFLDLANLIAFPAALLAMASGGALVWLARRRWHKALFALPVLLGLLALIPPAGAPARCAPGGQGLRLAWLNAHNANDPAPIIAWLERERPDAVGFAELGTHSPAVREAVRRAYPYAQSCHANDRCSTRLYSRTAPVAQAPLAQGDAQNRKALSALRMTLPMPGGERLNLMAAHLSRPLPLGRQAHELDRLARALERPGDTIIMGDFNATRRMYVLEGFLDRNGFAAAAAPPTWPLRLGSSRALPLVQIDHLLVGRGWAVRDIRLSGDLGSDHRGYVADLCPRG